jgi:hypothetical protein
VSAGCIGEHPSGVRSPDGIYVQSSDGCEDGIEASHADGTCQSDECWVHTVVGDGIPRRLRAVTGETHSMEVMGVGVRASVVAVKRGNSRGAKGGRKVDVQ